MSRFPLMLSAWLLAGISAAFAQQDNSTPAQSEKPKTETAGPAAEFKIPPEASARKNPVAHSAAGMAEAKHFYDNQCAMCHGKDGSGKSELAEVMKLKLADWRAADALATSTDGDLFYILTVGKGQMNGQGDRSSEHLRWNLVNYVRSFSAKKSTVAHTEAHKPK